MSDRKNSSCFNNLQLFNANCRPSKEVSTALGPTNHGVKGELRDDELDEMKKKI